MVTPCPRCGSADVGIQAEYSDLRMHGEQHNQPGLGETALAAPDVVSGVLAAALGLVVGFFAMLAVLGLAVARRLGWKPAPHKEPMVRFCHDCGWSEPTEKGA